MSERVGLIGCGTVGTAVAKALLARGYRLVVHDKFAAQAQPLLTDYGATWAESPAVLAKDVDVLLTALPAPQHVRAAMEDDGAL
jgi:3-hydroxyisobutyrate dehydrogenase|eukprot:COSAG02_NODE_1237_length_13725_cov_27.071921_7_plen_84_part_00